MKKFVFLISFLVLPLACVIVSGWMSESTYKVESDFNNGTRRPGDSLAQNFFPLTVGNSWTYKSLSNTGENLYIKASVLYDTLINNTVFYRLSNELPFFRGTLISLDTSTGNLYGYRENNECSLYRKGFLLDSLGSKLGDRVLACPDNGFYGKCMDTGKVTMFGAVRKTKFFLSPAFSDSGGFNRFTEGLGITYALKIEGLHLTTAHLIGCVLNNSVLGDTTTTTHIFGTVNYEDNNLPAQGGYVKAMKLDRTNGDIIILDSVQIQTGGFYYFHSLPIDDYYIVAYPNSEEESDFVPTYYPSTINWQNAARVNTGNNPENVKVSVYRKNDSHGSFSVAGTVYSQINQYVNGIKDVNIYLKQGNIFKSFSISKLQGIYHVNNLTSGSFQIIVNRLGYVNLKQDIIINNSNLQNINFFLEPTFIKSVNSTDSGPKKFILNQNYPNPFNPVTNIRFDIPRTAFVSLKIYNVTGIETAILVSEVKSAGSYIVDFNASNLSSGVYFYKLETDGFKDTKRMVVVK